MALSDSGLIAHEMHVGCIFIFLFYAMVMLNNIQRAEDGAMRTFYFL